MRVQSHNVRQGKLSTGVLEVGQLQRHLNECVGADAALLDEPFAVRKVAKHLKVQVLDRRTCLRVCLANARPCIV